MDASLETETVQRSASMEIDVIDVERILSEAGSYRDAILRKESPLLELVEKLGPLLTNSDAGKREAGLKCLTEIVTSVPQDYLTSQEVNCLLNFYLSRIKDHQSMVPVVLQGYHALASMKHLDEGGVLSIVQSLFSDVYIQLQLQSERYLVYKILVHFISNRLNDLKKLGPSFITGYVQLMEGERDPRCLLQALNIVPIMCSSFNISPFVKDIFDICACYFPIDFNPTSKDPTGITRDDLSQALVSCLVASPKFSGHCFDLILEKLDADLLSAKLDAFNLLVDACQSFPPVALKKYIFPLWTNIRRVVLENKDEKVTFAALCALTAMVKTLSFSVNEVQKGDTVSDFFKEIWKEIHDGDTLLLLSGSTILEAFAKGCYSACVRVIKYCFPTLLQLLSTSEVQRKVQVVELTVKLISTLRNYNAEPGEELVEPLELITDQYSIFLNNNNEELRNKAAEGLCIALQQDGLVKEPQLEALKEHLLNLILKESEVTLNQAHFTLLSVMTEKHPVLAEVVLKCLLKELSGDYDTIKVEKILKALASCSSTNLYLPLVTPQLLDHIKNSIQGNHYSDLGIAVCHSLLEAVSNFALRKDTDIHDSLFKSILKVWFDFLSAVNTNQLFNKQMLDILGQVVEKLAESLSDGVARDMFKQIQSECLRIFDLSTTCSEKSIHCTKTSCLVLLRSVVCHMRGCHVENMSFQLVSHLISQDEDDDSRIAAQCLAGLVNKTEKPELLEELLPVIESVLCPRWCFPKVQILLWTTKALLLRGHPSFNKLVSQLLELLKDNQAGKHISVGFEDILKPTPQVLSQEGHAIIKMMYAQRFFLQTVPPLLDALGTTKDQEAQSRYLTAILCQLKYVPKAVISTYIEKLVPVLIESLDSSDSELLQSVLPSVCENISMTVGHFETVLPRLLTLARPPNQMVIRKLSLQCLSEAASLSDTDLIPYKTRVVKGLIPCLGDPKRLVRHNAVQASCSWHIIGQPGS